MKEDLTVRSLSAKGNQVVWQPVTNATGYQYRILNSKRARVAAAKLDKEVTLLNLAGFKYTGDFSFIICALSGEEKGPATKAAFKFDDKGLHDFVLVADEVENEGDEPVLPELGSENQPQSGAAHSEESETDLAGANKEGSTERDQTRKSGTQTDQPAPDLTPLENRLSALETLLNGVQPGMLGKLARDHSALQEQVTTLVNNLEGLATRTDVNGLSEVVRQLEARVQQFVLRSGERLDQLEREHSTDDRRDNRREEHGERPAQVRLVEPNWKSAWLGYAIMALVLGSVICFVVYRLTRHSENNTPNPAPVEAAPATALSVEAEKLHHQEIIESMNREHELQQQKEHLQSELNEAQRRLVEPTLEITSSNGNHLVTHGGQSPTGGVIINGNVGNDNIINVNTGNGTINVTRPIQVIAPAPVIIHDLPPPAPVPHLPRPHCTSYIPEPPPAYVPPVTEMESVAAMPIGYPINPWGSPIANIYRYDDPSSGYSYGDSYYGGGGTYYGGGGRAVNFNLPLPPLIPPPSLFGIHTGHHR